MNLRDLGYLVALADTRHFGRAAASCGVSQPTLSSQIRRLEADLGAPLVRRDGGVDLTPLGQRVVESARTMLALADDIRDMARAQKGYGGDPVRVGIFPTLAPFLIGHLFSGAKARHPGLRLAVVEEKTAGLLTALSQRRIDVALLASRVPAPFVGVPVFREEFVLATPAGSALSRGGPVEPSSLAGVDLLLMSEGHCLRDQTLDLCSTTGASCRVDMSAASIGTLRELVAAGSGPALLPRLAVSAPIPDNPRVVLREFTEPRPHRDVQLVARPAVLERVEVQNVLDVCRHLPTDLVSPCIAQSPSA